MFLEERILKTGPGTLTGLSTDRISDSARIQRNLVVNDQSSQGAERERNVGAEGTKYNEY